MPRPSFSRRSLVPLLLLLVSFTAPVRAATPADSARASRDLARLRAVAPDLMNASAPLPGVATAGQPLKSHFAALRKAGYRTVVDLRTPEESRGFDEARVVKATGLAYLNIPVSHENLGAGQFDAFRKVMNDPRRRPVLVHCASANRVGAVMIPWLVLDRGMGIEEAVRDAKSIGMRTPDLETKARAYVSAHPRK